jgi:formate--tetrahydrofolate ligase
MAILAMATDLKDMRERMGKFVVAYSGEANKAIARIQADPELSKLGMCMVKTHLSLSDNSSLKGVPKGWRLTIREVLTNGGAGFIVPVAGTISLMPGTSSNPAFKRVDVAVPFPRPNHRHLNGKRA